MPEHNSTGQVNPPKTIDSKVISLRPTISPQNGNEIKFADNKSKDVAVDDFITTTMIRYPIYSYKTGTTWFLSKTEQIVVDAYIKTNSALAACKALNAIRAAHNSMHQYDVRAVTRWLKKPNVAAYIGEKFNDLGKVNWFDIAKWEAWGVDVLNGKISATQVQVAIWKEYGKAKGWYKEPSAQIMNNTQINFVQSDGKA